MQKNNNSNNYKIGYFFNIPYKLRKRPILNLILEMIFLCLLAFTIIMFVVFKRDNMNLADGFSIASNLFAMILLSIIGFILLADSTPPEESDIYFHFFSIGAFLGAFGDALFFITDGIKNLIILQHISISFSLLAAAILCLSLYCYENSICKSNYRIKKLLLYIAIFFFFVYIFVIILNIPFGYIYSIEDGFFKINEFSNIVVFYPLLILFLLFLGPAFRKKHNKRERLSIWSFVCFILLSIVTLILNGDYEYTFALAAIIDTILFGIIHINRSIEIAKQKEELVYKEQQLMVSQINPHFIYNTLTAIGYLCKTDPKLASNVVEWFAKYLRMNIDSLSRMDNIPFSKELEHTKCYLKIEQLRFSNIKIEYDITDLDFNLPMLTVQPIVENAVHYGIRNCENGLIQISSKLVDYYHVITIKDNGQGFDPRDTFYHKDATRSHLGIMNVRSRLEKMVNGTLKIKSTIGEGTVVEIKIPLI